MHDKTADMEVGVKTRVYCIVLKNLIELDWFKNYYKDFEVDFIKIDESQMKVFYYYDDKRTSYYWSDWIKDKGRFYAWRSKNKAVSNVDWSQNRDEMVGDRISNLDDLKDHVNFESLDDEHFRALYLALCQAESIMEKRC